MKARQGIPFLKDPKEVPMKLIEKWIAESYGLFAVGKAAKKPRGGGR